MRNSGIVMTGMGGGAVVFGGITWALASIADDLECYYGCSNDWDECGSHWDAEAEAASARREAARDRRFNIGVSMAVGLGAATLTAGIVMAVVGAIRKQRVYDEAQLRVRRRHVALGLRSSGVALHF